MKLKIFTIALMMIIGISVLKSQPVINYQSHAPQIGQSFTIIELWTPENVNPGPAGANVNWNFSQFEGEDEYTVNYIDPAQTPFADSLAGLNVNVAASVDYDWDDEESYSFLQVNQQQSSVKAFGFIPEEEPPVFITLNPAPIVMKFPFAYGNSFESYSEYAWELSDDFSMVVKEWTINTADAWGSLTNAMGTYNNVLRVKSAHIDSTFIYIGGQLFSSDGSESAEYAWFSPFRTHPVMLLAGEIEDGEFHADWLEYLSDESASVIDPTITQVVTYPNPATDILHVENLNNGRSNMIAITDMMGRIVFETRIADRNKMQIDVSSLPTGMYLLQELMNTQVISSSKIMISR